MKGFKFQDSVLLIRRPLSGASYTPSSHFDSNSIPSKMSTSANSGATAITPETRVSMMALQIKMSNLSVAGTSRTQAMEMSNQFAYGFVVFPSWTSDGVGQRWLRRSSGLGFGTH